MTPYGEAQSFPEPDGIFKQLQPFTCEWLVRPEVAFSELADSFASNIPLLTNNSQDILHPSLIQMLNEEFNPIMPALQQLNKKDAAGTSGTMADAKTLLQALEDNETRDDNMEKNFHMASAMMTISGNYMIVTALIRHPQQFVNLIQPSTKISKNFLNSGKAKDMKEHLLQSFPHEEEESPQVASKPKSRKAPQNVRKSLLQSSSDEESHDKSNKTSKHKKTLKQSWKQELSSGSSSESSSSSDDDSSSNHNNNQKVVDKTSKEQKKNSIGHQKQETTKKQERNPPSKRLITKMQPNKTKNQLLFQLQVNKQRFANSF